MAGSLILVDSETASSSASISLTGIDSTYDVYQVVISNLECATDVQDVFLRFTVSGSADSSSNYENFLPSASFAPLYPFFSSASLYLPLATSSACGSNRLLSS